MRAIMAMAASLLLTGCQQDDVTLAQACAGLNGYCETGIVSDSACKRERQDVLVRAYRLENDALNNATREDLQFSQLLALEDLMACAYKQSLIEYKPAKMRFPELVKKDRALWTDEEKRQFEDYTLSIHKRKNAKRQNYVQSRAYLNTLADNTRDVKHPYLLYWHWSRQQYKPAIEQLRRMHQQGYDFDYDMRYYLAQEYGKYDPGIALKLMIETLERYPTELYTEKSDEERDNVKFHAQSDGERLHYAVIRDLVSLYFQQQNFSASYIWAKVLHNQNDRSADSDMIVDYMRKTQQPNLSRLDDIAEQIDDQLASGDFSPGAFSELKG